MSGLGQRPPKTFSITVAAGSGSTTINDMGGNVIGYSVKTPGAGAYNIEFTDSDDYGLAADTGLNGDTTIYQEFQAYDGMTCTISGAATPGTYTVRVWFKAG